jgi:hypothetical protein
MASDSEYMRAYRVETRRTNNLTVPVSVLATLLALSEARTVLHHHFGPDLCDAIRKAGK